VAHATHASLPDVALKVSLGHALHTRSVFFVGAVVWYSPLAHVLMSRHTRSEDVVAAVKMNWWSPHILCASQSRSVLAVGAVFSYSVLVHCVTVTHELPSFTPE
jgi:hypothetical protein